MSCHFCIVYFRNESFLYNLSEGSNTYERHSCIFIDKLSSIVMHLSLYGLFQVFLGICVVNIMRMIKSCHFMFVWLVRRFSCDIPYFSFHGLLHFFLAMCRYTNENDRIMSFHLCMAYCLEVNRIYLFRC